MTAYGYARVSRGRDDGTNTLQNQRLRLTGVDAAHIHQDSITRAVMHRPSLNGLPEVIRAGDVLCQGRRVHSGAVPAAGEQLDVGGADPAQPSLHSFRHETPPLPRRCFAASASKPRRVIRCPKTNCSARNTAETVFTAGSTGVVEATRLQQLRKRKGPQAE